MCQAEQNWTEALLLILLCIGTSFKADLQSSVAELVYGEPLRIPGELLTPAENPADPAYLITQLHQHITRLRPVPATRHANPCTFIHKDLTNCTYIFLRQDSTCRALQPPYSCPYQVLSRKDKTLKLLVRGKPFTVSADRVKPAYILNENNSEHTIPKPADRLILNHQSFFDISQAFDKIWHTGLLYKFRQSLHLNYNLTLISYLYWRYFLAKV
jgi:hypothetical protein